MAVYRADQAQVTFMTEPAAGGYVETIASDATISGGSATLTAATNAGSSSIGITLDSNADWAVGNTVQIGRSATSQNELREVLHITGRATTSGDTPTLYLSAPTSFYHAAGIAIKGSTPTDAELQVSGDQYINLIPGAYETVDVPDPEMAIEGRWFLGTTSKRAFYAAYSGQQTYAGSIGGFALLDGKSLRYSIGRVNTATTYINVTGTTNDPTYGARVAGAHKKGDIYLTFKDTAAANIVTNSRIFFTGTTTEQNVVLGTATQEVRKHVGDDHATAIQLDYPLQFDHADNEYVYIVMTEGGGTGTTVAIDSNVSATAPIPYTHTISETVDLDSVSWHVHMMPSDETRANAFDRRYYGGKIGSMSLSGEEGGMVTASWDSVNFLGMIHNQKTVDLSADIQTPFFGNMQSIVNSEVDFPTSEPYYFSQGEVTMFGQTIARIRSFSLSISNNEEPRYYISKQMGRKRGPTEIREQRREYSMSVTLALPDAAAANTAQRTVFQEMLLEGNYGSAADFIRTGKKGFDVVITLTKGDVVTNFEDKITVTIPDDGAAATGGNQQGAFIRTAPHNITEDNPFQVEADILFRNLKIEVQDAEHYYP
tara:strand:- start:1807 stop:3600 length:1794 start_codon:yes stop_codon:yes gene_type:complete